MEQVLQWLNDNSSLFIFYGINIIVALIILIIGSKVARLCATLLKKSCDKKNIDPVVAGFVGNLLYSLVFAAVVLMALSRIGIETTSFIAILGAAGLAIGLALQGSLSNFASGVLIIVLRPFKSGDFIEAAGQSGSVEKIEIFATELRTPDNKVVIVPNSAIMSGSITNYTREKTRRVDLVIGVGYDADLKQAKQVLTFVLENNDKVLAEPASIVAVVELGDSSVNFVVRPWVNTDDYWNVYFEILEASKIALDDANISIPFPQMDVHVKKEQ